MAKPEYAVPVADVVETLGGVPLFEGVKPKDLKKLAGRMQERTFSEGDAITSEGKSGIGFFLIEDGNATVSIDGKIVRTLGPGEFFGELAAIDWGAGFGRTRSATVKATEPTRLLVLDWVLVNWLMKAAPAFGDRLETTSRERLAAL